VLTLRDVEGLAAADVCSMLEISEANERVLLHRARGRVRVVLEEYLERNL
jgi:RNA polymerase sigma-70 factor, ECF subfamily